MGMNTLSFRVPIIEKYLIKICFHLHLTESMIYYLRILKSTHMKNKYKILELKKT